tara:strand:+ start:336 stop:611 length:276 start_codon:yes stop_codon:yes gene_type:complete
MDATILICLIFIYLVLIWIIGFNIFSDNRFSSLSKKITITCLFIPPIGVILFLLFKLKNRTKPRPKMKIKTPNSVYRGGYQGGHNKPRNLN